MHVHSSPTLSFLRSRYPLTCRWLASRRVCPLSGIWCGQSLQVLIRFECSFTKIDAAVFCLSTLHIITSVHDTASDSQREVVCDAAEQLQDRGKLLSKSVSVRDDSATVVKTLFNSLAHTTVSKGVFMPTAPLAFLLSRAHAAATHEHGTESFATSSAMQLRSRSGGQGVAKRRGSVSWLVSFAVVSYLTCLPGCVAKGCFSRD